MNKKAIAEKNFDEVITGLLKNAKEEFIDKKQDSAIQVKQKNLLPTKQN